MDLHGPHHPYAQQPCSLAFPKETNFSSPADYKSRTLETGSTNHMPTNNTLAG